MRNFTLCQFSNMMQILFLFFENVFKMILYQEWTLHLTQLALVHTAMLMKLMFLICYVLINGVCVCICVCAG